MGAGCRMSDLTNDVKDVLKRVPVDPPFSLSDLKKAIPAHCFKRSIIRSSYYWVDDTVGFIVHSALFTPYFSWKYSHRSHHANTNSLDNDEVYIPKRMSKVRNYSKVLNNPPGRVFTLVFRLILGFPLYLLTNVSRKKYERFANHFDPFSPIFTERERLQVVLSDLSILAIVCALKLLVAAKGFTWVMCMYGVPVIGVHAFFVLITYLHHIHLSLPHYDSTEWKWIKGSLSTIDRDFGFLNRVFHDVTHTHVLHHLISYIPHYHAKEARDAIKPLLGDYYKIDRTPIFKAMWREAKECIYIEPDQDTEHKGVY
ncbi:hypothetical protein L1987_29502 [Smallanthus sonchifolius]|uniref:Uncharacterized protein n=1 Tax=Smallanthus sonchifolius TaxID=185202 RepID=A0ACB9I025_9ASTR|nr:hypothetical protein L1987_29502 [Smallanthus sonchifolius]